MSRVSTLIQILNEELNPPTDLAELNELPLFSGRVLKPSSSVPVTYPALKGALQEYRSLLAASSASVEEGAGEAVVLSIAEMAAVLSQRYNVTVSSDSVALAARVFEATPTSQVDMPEQDVVQHLVQSGTLPMSAIDPDEPAPSEASQKRGFPYVGTSLALVPSKGRPKNQTDEDRLDWMHRVIVADRAIRQDEHSGKPFRPEWTARYRDGKATGILYRDPLSQFLEPHEYSSDATRTPFDGTHNVMFAGVEKLDLFEENPNQSFTWRSTQILQKFERYLLSLWCVNTECQNCGLPMAGLNDEVKQILRGELFLPETTGVKPSRIYMGSKYHPWCVSLRSERIKISQEFNRIGRETGDPNGLEAIAFRTAAYVSMFSEIVYEHREAGATNEIVIEAWKAYNRLKKEMINRAR